MTDHEFIFTVPGRHTSPQMCYREDLSHTPMERWVRCHLNEDGKVVLGPKQSDDEQTGYELADYPDYPEGSDSE